MVSEASVTVAASGGEPADRSDVHSPYLLSGPAISPLKRLSTLESAEWEELIEDWLATKTADYVKVERPAGAGDHGVDVACFASTDGFEGDWDSFQCKHYKNPLAPSNVWPEILKTFRSVVRGEYVLPRLYSFVAPKGCSTALTFLMNSPDKFRAEFLEKISAGGAFLRDLRPGEQQSIETLAARTSFSFIQSVTPLSLIEGLRTGPHFITRFGGTFPARPAPKPVPAALAVAETVYVRHLLDAYIERDASLGSVAAVMSDVAQSVHFRRQREYFYRAESLRILARDSLPASTFEHLKTEFYEAVVESAEEEHDSGLACLKAVLDAAVRAQISANALISVTEVSDKKGICHQLANENRLKWVK